IKVECMEKPKITLLVGSLAGGGAEGVCVSIANGLASRGWDITIVVLNLKDAVNQARISSSVRLVNLEVSNVRYSFWKLFKYIVSGDCRTILVFDHLLAVVLILLRLASGRKLNIIARNINTMSQEVGGYTSFWYKHIVAR